MTKRKPRQDRGLSDSVVNLAKHNFTPKLTGLQSVSVFARLAVDRIALLRAGPK